MSKKCISCGIELEDDARFCDECGVCQENSEEKEVGLQNNEYTEKVKEDTNTYVNTGRSSSRHSSGCLGTIIKIVIVVAIIIFAISKFGGKDVKIGDLNISDAVELSETPIDYFIDHTDMFEIYDAVKENENFVKEGSQISYDCTYQGGTGTLTASFNINPEPGYAQLYGAEWICYPSDDKERKNIEENTIDIFESKYGEYDTEIDGSRNTYTWTGDNMYIEMETSNIDSGAVCISIAYDNNYYESHMEEYVEFYINNEFNNSISEANILPYGKYTNDKGDSIVIEEFRGDISDSRIVISNSTGLELIYEGIQRGTYIECFTSDLVVCMTISVSDDMEKLAVLQYDMLDYDFRGFYYKEQSNSLNESDVQKPESNDKELIKFEDYIYYDQTADEMASSLQYAGLDVVYLEGDMYGYIDESLLIKNGDIGTFMTMQTNDYRKYSIFEIHTDMTPEEAGDVLLNSKGAVEYGYSDYGDQEEWQYSIDSMYYITIYGNSGQNGINIEFVSQWVYGGAGY